MIVGTFFQKPPVPDHLKRSSPTKMDEFRHKFGKHIPYQPKGGRDYERICTICYDYLDDHSRRIYCGRCGKRLPNNQKTRNAHMVDHAMKLGNGPIGGVYPDGTVWKDDRNPNKEDHDTNQSEKSD